MRTYMVRIRCRKYTKGIPIYYDPLHMQNILAHLTETDLLMNRNVVTTHDSTVDDDDQHHS
jgi:hypothetical protein